MAQLIHRPDSLLRCGFQRHLANSSQVIETPQYALVYFISGRASYEMAGRNYDIIPGSVAQRFPNQIHTIHFYSDCESHYAALPEPAFNLIQRFNPSSLTEPVFHIGLHATLIKQFTQLSKELRSRIPQHQIDVAGHILQLLINLHQSVQSTSQHATLFIRKACELLSTDLDTALDMPRIASELDMSYPSFRKRFKQEMGISPGSYRIQQRIEAAKHYLLDCQSINEISHNLGYPDCYTFSKQFKKFTGMTASDYKKRQGLH